MVIYRQPIKIYDVLVMDSPLDKIFISHLERDLEKTQN